MTPYWDARPRVDCWWKSTFVSCGRGRRNSMPIPHFRCISPHSGRTVTFRYVSPSIICPSMQYTYSVYFQIRAWWEHWVLLPWPCCHAGYEHLHECEVGIYEVYLSITSIYRPFIFTVTYERCSARLRCGKGWLESMIQHHAGYHLVIHKYCANHNVSYNHMIFVICVREGP